mmetsp:Transcript_42485/g.99711  ORF Transcript_42485/g.99711 Transcript_42485/m.99711 type:complete len:334 (+) Transcript_42485:315-1316(+)
MTRRITGTRPETPGSRHPSETQRCRRGVRRLRRSRHSGANCVSRSTSALAPSCRKVQATRAQPSRRPVAADRLPFTQPPAVSTAWQSAQSPPVRARCALPPTVARVGRRGGRPRCADCADRSTRRARWSTPLAAILGPCCTGLQIPRSRTRCAPNLPRAPRRRTARRCARRPWGRACVTRCLKYSTTTRGRPNCSRWRRRAARACSSVRWVARRPRATPSSPRSFGRPSRVRRGQTARSLRPKTTTTTTQMRGRAFRSTSRGRHYASQTSNSSRAAAGRRATADTCGSQRLRASRSMRRSPPSRRSTARSQPRAASHRRRCRRATRPQPCSGA